MMPHHSWLVSSASFPSDQQLNFIQPFVYRLFSLLFYEGDWNSIVVEGTLQHMHKLFMADPGMAEICFTDLRSLLWVPRSLYNLQISFGTCCALWRFLDPFFEVYRLSWLANIWFFFSLERKFFSDSVH